MKYIYLYLYITNFLQLAEHSVNAAIACSFPSFSGPFQTIAPIFDLVKKQFLYLQAIKKSYQLHGKIKGNVTIQILVMS